MASGMECGLCIPPMVTLHLHIHAVTLERSRNDRSLGMGVLRSLDAEHHA